ncbi:Superoxide dismutase [Mn] [Arsenophonus endosymbiont of Bemisia tabaci Q2]|nr:Superoxide dismutase [Mn] [Arsenophonus endosymbiont of Bemisia tabaci Q2]
MRISYTLASLPYEYGVLEPHFHESTMKIHHTKHHQIYVINTNDALKNFPELAKLDIEDLIQNLDKGLVDKRTFLRNNAGGHANHSMFWNGLKTGTKLKGKLKSAIERDFASVENFKEIFEKAVATRFGSGWAWVSIEIGWKAGSCFDS